MEISRRGESGEGSCSRNVTWQDGSGNSDSFFKARQSNAGFRASVFANPMVPHALSWLCLSALSLIYLGSPKPIVNLRKLRQPHGVVLLFFFITLKPEEG